MEEVLWRFPHIGEKTFKMLSNKNLAKCKTVSRTWDQFIKNDRVCKQRAHYENIQKDKNIDGDTELHKKACLPKFRRQSESPGQVRRDLEKQ